MNKKVTLVVLNILLIGSLSLYLGGIVSLRPNGYHIDIYSQLGYAVILGYMFTFISAMLLQTLVDRSKKWLYLVIVLATYIGVITIPHLLGYYLSDRGDSLHSVGYIRAILQTGQIDPLDIYPAHWILLAITTILPGITLDKTLLLSMILNNFIFILSLLLFAKRYNSIVLIYFAMAFLLTYYHETIIAEFFAYTLNTLVFYFLISYNPYNGGYRKRSIIVLTILLITLIFSHPFVAFFNLGILMMLVLLPKLHPKRINVKTNIYNTILTVYIVALVIWVSWQRMLIQNLISMPEFIRKMFIVKQVSYATSMSGVSHLDLVRYFIIHFWGQILLCLTAVAIVLMYFKAHRGKSKVLTGLFEHRLEILVMLWSIAFTVILILQKHGYDRVFGLNFMIFGAVVVISAVNQKIQLSKWHKALILVLIIVMPFSVFSAFNSPVNGMPYTGITYEELIGAKFSFSHLDYDQKIIDPIGEAKRWSIWLYGYSETFKKRKVLYLYKLPDHFGYRTVTCFSENRYIERIEHNILGYQEKYMYYYPRLLVVVPDYPIEMYEKAPLFKKVARFRYNDEKRLRADYSVNVIYYGSNLRVYKPIPCDNS